MGDKKQLGKRLKPLTERERWFVTDNYYLIGRFLKIKKVDPEMYFDTVVFDFLLSAQVWLEDTELQKKANFESVSFKYMERALFNEYTRQKAKKRCSGAGADVSFENAEIENYLKGNGTEGIENLEYLELLTEIEGNLTEEQNIIFSGKLTGYTLKEIAETHGIAVKRVYRQYAKVKGIVAEIMGMEW